MVNYFRFVVFRDFGALGLVESRIGVLDDLQATKRARNFRLQKILDKESESLEFTFNETGFNDLIAFFSGFFFSGWK